MVKNDAREEGRADVLEFENNLCWLGTEYE
jgi:hypothetical protein